jgi:hypothetical protein
MISQDTVMEILQSGENSDSLVTMTKAQFENVFLTED